MKLLVITALCATSALAAECLPLTGDRILGRDLALANPAFSALPANTTIGYAPAPGTKRTFLAPELTRIAHTNGLALAAPEEICFEFPMRALNEQEVLISMRRSLPAGAELKMIELPRTQVPVGALEFQLTGLEPASPGTNVRMWRGSVKYSDTLRARIWARVDVRCPIEAVVAVSELPPNVPVSASRLRIQTVNAPLDQTQLLARRIEDVAGSIPRKSISPGAPIPLAAIDLPPAVRRGDSVRVEVQSGLARVQIEAVAETAARTGDMVELRNPMSGRTFRARLEAGGKAVIVVGAGQKL